MDIGMACERRPAALRAVFPLYQGENQTLPLIQGESREAAGGRSQAMLKPAFFMAD